MEGSRAALLYRVFLFSRMNESISSLSFKHQDKGYSIFLSYGYNFSYLIEKANNKKLLFHVSSKYIEIYER